MLTVGFQNASFLRPQASDPRKSLETLAFWPILGYLLGSVFTLLRRPMLTFISWRSGTVASVCFFLRIENISDTTTPGRMGCWFQIIVETSTYQCFASTFFQYCISCWILLFSAQESHSLSLTWKWWIDSIQPQIGAFNKRRRCKSSCFLLNRISVRSSKKKFWHFPRERSWNTACEHLCPKLAIM